MRASLFVLLLLGCREEPLPSLMPLGAWSLTDQDGEAFGSDALRDKVWIADFVFTSCPDVCPMMSTQMSNLTRRVDERVHFVSISVDPEHDTPQRMREYAERYRADTDRWHFLTGTEDEVRGVIVDRFRHHVGDRNARDDGRYEIMHGVRFVLVDQRGVVRGHYETDRAGLEALERDAERLLE